VRAALLLLATVLALTGCSTWRAQGLTPHAVIGREHPERLQVATLAGERIVLTSPRVVGDSLVGVVDGARCAIPLAEIEQVAVRRENETRSRIAFPLVAGCLLAMFLFAQEMSAIGL
jgi:hypothetical protein